MKLSIPERSQILGLLPQRESFDMLKLLRKFRESLSLSQEELTEVRWQHEYKCSKCGQTEFLPVPVQCGKCSEWLEDTGRVTWDNTKDPHKDVFIPPAILSIIVVTLKKLSDKKQLPDELVDLYAKFIVGQEQENGKEGKGNNQ